MRRRRTDGECGRGARGRGRATRPGRAWVWVGARACLLGASLLAACTDAPTRAAPPGAVDLAAPWDVVQPAAVDLQETVLNEAAAQASAIPRFRSLLVVRRGGLAFERYFGGTDATTLADLRSVTKSVVATLTGIAIQRGDLRSLDQPLGEILRPPEFQLTPVQAEVTVRHLLTMTSGFAWQEDGAEGYNDWIRSDDHVKYLLSQPHDQTPGAGFLYNSAAVHLLGVALEEATGRTLPAYADQFLFGPSGVGPRVWEDLPGGRVNGGSGLDLRPRDAARLGQLMLQEGWSGTRSVVPEEWVAEATARRFGWTTSAGPLNRISYGFLWWTDEERGGYFAWGFGGQFVYVHPGLEMVVVVTTDWRGLTSEGGPGPLQDSALSVLAAVMNAPR